MNDEGVRKTDFDPTVKVNGSPDLGPLMFGSPANVPLLGALLPIEHDTPPDPFDVARHDAEPTWIVRRSTAGTRSPLREETIAVNNTEPSLPTAAFDALSETAAWLLSFAVKTTDVACTLV